jgi:hypothetical protein
MQHFSTLTVYRTQKIFYEKNGERIRSPILRTSWRSFLGLWESYSAPFTLFPWHFARIANNRRIFQVAQTIVFASFQMLLNFANNIFLKLNGGATISNIGMNVCNEREG